MTKTRMAKHKIDVMQVSLSIYTTDSIEKTRNTKPIIKVLGGEFHGNFKGLWSFRNDDCFIFFQYDYLTRAIVSHEIYHAATDICEMNGIHVKEPSGQETAALLTELITTLVYADLKRWGIKVKP